MALSVFTRFACKFDIRLYPSVNGISIFLCQSIRGHWFDLFSSQSFSGSQNVRSFSITQIDSCFDEDAVHSVNDNSNLASRASSLLVRMCGVTPPAALINPILDAIFDAIQTSPVYSVFTHDRLFSIDWRMNSPGESDLRHYRWCKVCLDFSWAGFPIDAYCLSLVFYFRHIPLISEIRIVQMLEVIILV